MNMNDNDSSQQSSINLLDNDSPLQQRIVLREQGKQQQQQQSVDTIKRRGGTNQTIFTDSDNDNDDKKTNAVNDDDDDDDDKTIDPVLWMGSSFNDGVKQNNNKQQQERSNNEQSRSLAPKLVSVRKILQYGRTINPTSSPSDTDTTISDHGATTTTTTTNANDIDIDNIDDDQQYEEQSIMISPATKTLNNLSQSQQTMNLRYNNLSQQWNKGNNNNHDDDDGDNDDDNEERNNESVIESPRRQQRGTTSGRGKRRRKTFMQRKRKRLGTTTATTTKETIRTNGRKKTTTTLESTNERSQDRSRSTAGGFVRKGSHHNNQRQSPTNACTANAGTANRTVVSEKLTTTNVETRPNATVVNDAAMSLCLLRKVQEGGGGGSVGIMNGSPYNVQCQYDVSETTIHDIGSLGLNIGSAKPPKDLIVAIVQYANSANLSLMYHRSIVPSNNMSDGDDTNDRLSWPIVIEKALVVTGLMKNSLGGKSGIQTDDWLFYLDDNVNGASGGEGVVNNSTQINSILHFDYETARDMAKSGVRPLRFGLARLRLPGCQSTQQTYRSLNKSHNLKPSELRSSPMRISKVTPPHVIELQDVNHLDAKCTEKIQHHDSQTVPFCYLCNQIRNEKNKADRVKFHHAWCPHNTHFVRSGGKIILEQIQQGIQRGCKACISEWKEGKAYVPRSHSNDCAKKISLEKTKSTKSRNQEKKAATKKQQKRKRSDERKSSKQKVTNKTDKRRKKSVTSARKNERDDDSESESSLSNTYAQSKRGRIKTRKDNRNSSTQTNTKIDKSMKALPGGDVEVLPIGVQNNGTAPSETVEIDADSDVKLTVQWETCENPWGTSGHIDGDIVLYRSSPMIESFETIHEGVAEFFTLYPFAVQPNRYYQTHCSPDEGFRSVVLNRNAVATRPWGFVFHRHEFGGACIITTVDPLSPASAATCLGGGPECIAPLRVHDMIISINGKRVGGMNMSTAQQELEVCGSQLILVISRYKFAEQISREKERNEGRIMKSIDTTVNETKWLDWVDMTILDICESSDSDDSGSDTTSEISVCDTTMNDDSVFKANKNTSGNEVEGSTSKTVSAISEHKWGCYAEENSLTKENMQCAQRLVNNRNESMSCIRDNDRTVHINPNKEPTKVSLDSQNPKNKRLTEGSQSFVHEMTTDKIGRELSEESSSSAASTSDDSNSIISIETSIAQESRNEIDPSEESDDNSSQSDSEGNVLLPCVCGIRHGKNTRTFWIQCDNCSSWYNVQNACIGFGVKKAQSISKWTCPGCPSTQTSNIEDNENRGRVNDNESKEKRIVLKSHVQNVESQEYDLDPAIIPQDRFIIPNRPVQKRGDGKWIRPIGRKPRGFRWDENSGFWCLDDTMTVDTCKGKTTTEPRSIDVNGKSTQDLPPEEKTQNEDMNVNVPFQTGDIVEILEHSWPGVNHIGGVAKIVDSYIDEDGDQLYDVKYVVERSIHREILARFVRKHNFCRTKRL